MEAAVAVVVAVVVEAAAEAAAVEAVVEAVVVAVALTRLGWLQPGSHPHSLRTTMHRLPQQKGKRVIFEDSCRWSSCWILLCGM